MPTPAPLIFVSHSHEDKELIPPIKKALQKVFAKSLDLFATSRPDAIPKGSKWMDEIEKKLDHAKYVFVLITPRSVYRPWLWFELGYTWKQPVTKFSLVLGLDQSDLPRPIADLQSVPLADAEHLKELFVQMNEKLETKTGVEDQFGKASTALAKQMETLKSSLPTPSSSGDFQVDLKIVLETLVKQGSLTPTALDVFTNYGLLPQAIIEALKGYVPSSTRTP
jgi:hypothetical protein